MNPRLPSLGLITALWSAASCSVNGHGEAPRQDELAGGGVYVAYNLGCEEGCKRVRRGDRIVAVDGVRVASREEFESRLSSGGNTLDVVPRRGGDPNRVRVQGKPRDLPAGLDDPPPILTVGAEALGQTPAWARKLMFSHAMPPFAAVHMEGGFIDGAQLYGQRSIVFVWPYPESFAHDARAPRPDFVAAYQAFQSAAANLEREGTRLVFVMDAGGSDSGVRQTLDQIGLRDPEDQPLPPLEIYRTVVPELMGFPRNADRAQLATGASPARRVGVQRSASNLFQYVREFPVLIVLDDGGIVRWHSEGFRVKGPAPTVEAAVAFSRSI